MPHNIDRIVSERQSQAQEDRQYDAHEASADRYYHDARDAEWEQEILSPKQLAEEYGWSYQQVKKAIDDGRVRAKQLGGGPVRPRYGVTRSNAERFFRNA